MAGTLDALHPQSSASVVPVLWVSSNALIPMELEGGRGLRGLCARKWQQDFLNRIDAIA